MPAGPLAVASLAGMLLAAGAAGCGGASSTGAAAGAATGPEALLRQAKATVDGASALHFVLRSSGARGSGTSIVGGEGDAARPDELRGSFTVSLGGLPVTVKVLAAAGRFYVQAPFSSSYVATNPDTYGIGDPAQLIDPTRGLSSLLPDLTQLRSAGQTRIGAEIADVVDGQLPGARLPVLPDADRSRPVAVTVDVVTGSHQVRRLALTGPFTSSTPTTYTVDLTGYGESVSIAAPTG